MILGWKSIGAVMIVGAFMGGLWAAIGLLTKRYKGGDEQPMGQFIAAAAAITMVFFF